MAPKKKKKTNFDPDSVKWLNFQQDTLSLSLVLFNKIVIGLPSWSSSSSVSLGCDGTIKTTSHPIASINGREISLV